MSVSPGDGEYTLDSVFPGTSLDSLPRGTNLLFAGDDTNGATDLMYRALARAPPVGESVILVAIDASAGVLVEQYQSVLRDEDALDHLYVVDASASGLDRDIGPLSPTHVESASSPADVTGIGIGVTNILRSIQTDRVRVGVVSLSPIVDRLGPERAFAFFHVLTSRIRTAGLLGLFAVDPSRHEPDHLRILQSLTDGTLTFQTTAEGAPAVRGDGVVEALSEWTTIE